jgi:(E)-4-hydroxy-3-methylbut-2-enyl-diphosphate synthase
MNGSVSSGIKRRVTRSVYVNDLVIGSEGKISVQSMCATKTQSIEATLQQINLLQEHGADLIRVAVDSKKDVEALAIIRSKTNARLVVDLQENYRLAESLAPFVQKIRYNPGHLHHHERDVPVAKKVEFLVRVARHNNLALRVGVNFGSLDPEKKKQGGLKTDVALQSVSEHIKILEELNFSNYVVSLKSSNPNDVVFVNQEFARLYPMIPLHLGVTEAGLLPFGEIKSRIAFEKLLALGIGDTIRVSLTLPFEKKYEEILIGKKIIKDVYEGRFISVPRFEEKGLNIISCPSCSRVENEAFVELAEKVKEVTASLRDKDITIAVMGCRVNGPGETDEADIGLWCAPKHVNLKRGEELIGAFSYEEIVPKLMEEIEVVLNKQDKAI